MGFALSRERLVCSDILADEVEEELVDPGVVA